MQLNFLPSLSFYMVGFPNMCCAINVNDVFVWCDIRLVGQQMNLTSFLMATKWIKGKQCTTWPMLWEGCLTFGGMMLRNSDLKDGSTMESFNLNPLSNSYLSMLVSLFLTIFLTLISYIFNNSKYQIFNILSKELKS